MDFWTLLNESVTGSGSKFSFLYAELLEVTPRTKNTTVTSPGKRPAVCPLAGKRETSPPDWVLSGSSCWLGCKGNIRTLHLSSLQFPAVFSVISHMSVYVDDKPSLSGKWLISRSANLLIKQRLVFASSLLSEAQVLMKDKLLTDLIPDQTL